ncbi:MAG: leucine-rich repeat domain-containing protein [Clostridia bacterium]|nr:leucine-rich repeat domain-containing protein [Clostridia bacterium]
MNYPVGWTTVTGLTNSILYRSCIFNGTLLETLEIPEGITQIPANAFDGCTNFTHFDLPQSLTSIQTETFRGCSGLTEMIIPPAVVSIGKGAFADCTRLTSVTMNNGLQSIERDAFRNCPALGKTYIYPSVTSIGSNAFSGWEDLEIHCEYGSVALQYAIDNSIPYFYLSLTGASRPSGTLYSGDTFALYGYVRSSEPIISVTATIYNADGSDILQTVTVAPGITDYSLSGTVNANMLFANLPLGNYCYSLVATARDETEILQSCMFTIAPPPLRVHLSGMTPLDGTVGTDYRFTGTISSNYAITSVNATLTRVDTSATVATYSASPATLTASLTPINDSIDFSKLPLIGEYAFVLKITANGQVRTLYSGSFMMGDYDGAIDDTKFSEIVEFASDPKNVNLFAEYNDEMTYLGNMDGSDIFLMAVNSYSEVLRAELLGLFTGEDTSRYKIDLYKKEITDLIDDLDENISLVTANDTYLKASNSLKDYGKIVFTEVFDGQKYFMTEYLQDMYDTMNGTIEGYSTYLDGVDWMYMSIETITAMMQNYENGLKVIAVYAENNPGDAEFAVALDELASEYSSKIKKAWTAAIKKLADDLIGKAVDEAIKAFLGTVSSKAGGLYSIVTFAIDVSMELSGYGEVAENLETFMIQCNTYTTAKAGYMKAFNEVLGGDTSTRALNKLEMNFRLARQSGMRIYDTMVEIAGHYTDEGQRLVGKWGELNLMIYSTPFDN